MVCSALCICIVSIELPLALAAVTNTSGGGDSSSATSQSEGFPSEYVSGISATSVHTRSAATKRPRTVPISRERLKTRAKGKDRAGPGSGWSDSD